MIDIDSLTGTFSCPRCRQQVTQTFARLKSQEEIPCPGCGVGFRVEPESLRAALDAAQGVLDDFARSIGSLGQRQ